MNHIGNAISELERQREAIDQALSALREIAHRDAPNHSGMSPNTRRLSAKGRKNIIAAMKKRWAEKRAAESNGVSKKKSVAKPRPKLKLSAAARKKMSEAAKKRWAAKKKQAA